AADGMVDPRFQQSVILLLQHGQEGTVGLIVNKPLPISLEHAL
ncbi:MAG: YqgE/AlgH family protein, partial [Desulfuromonadales bacterium]|nr:YqgE/AlgH family protein [Desulfuromonadales bacterium]NIS39815.1 YqgE/AlgH family protein [Desulfuromonadales bacterium]